MLSVWSKARAIQQALMKIDKVKTCLMPMLASKGPNMHAKNTMGTAP